MYSAPSRLLLFENGAALGVFSDAQGEDDGGGGHSAVVMEPSGACFTQVRQDGDCHRQLSDFCRRDLIPQVAAVSSFRNAHSPRPYLSRRVHAASTYGQQERSNSSSNRRRRRRTPPCFAQWPTAATTASAAGAATAATKQASSSCCTVYADGTVEVRAVGGNARLTLSASGTTAEVDYAVAIPDPPGSTPTAAAAVAVSPIKMSPREEHSSGLGGGMGRGAMVREPGAATAEAMKKTGPAENFSCTTTTTSRVWVTRRFFVGSAPSDVPPEFSHALAVAVALGAPSSSSPAARDDDAAVLGAQGGGAEGVRVGASAGDEAVAGGGGREGALVTSELPWPEDRPDHASWDTVVQAAASPPRFDSSPHQASLGYCGAEYDWRKLARRSAAAAAAAAAAPSTYSARTSAIVRAAPGLLSVDVMKLAKCRGFAGELAPVLESIEGCTYRVVVVRDGAGGGGGGGGRDKVSVHVVVHADGTEVWLEGDFVRLSRPRSPLLPLGTTTLAQQQQRRQRPEEAGRILHVSAASTIHFRVRVPSRAPPPPPPRPEHAGDSATAVAAASSETRSSRRSNSGDFVASSGGGAAAAAGGGILSMSLGDIASRAVALRQQFVTYSTAAAATGGRGKTGTGTGTGTSIAQRTRERPNVRVKIKPPTVLSMTLRREAGAATARDDLSLPFGASVAAAVRSTKSSNSARTAITQQQQEISSAAAAAGAAYTSTAGAAPPNVFARMATAVVVESVERGGASFVAFSDGRARGAFADRTIVNLGARISYLPLPLLVSSAQPGGGGGLRRRGCGAAAAVMAELNLMCAHSGADEQEEEDREIECIRPDGTVVRLTERSMGRRRQQGRFDADGFTGRLGGFGNTTGGSFSISTTPTIGGGSTDTVLRPYVVAVLRFAEWAATPPAERQAATDRGAAGRVVAAAEAERNRRFIDLQRLAKLASLPPQPPSSSLKCQTPLIHQLTSGRTWSAGGEISGSCCNSGGGGGGGACDHSRRGGGGLRRATSASDLLRQGAEDINKSRHYGDSDKENMGAVHKRFFFEERKRGVVAGPPPPPPPRGARERNALVARLLEANREVLIGKEVSKTLAQGNPVLL